MIMNSLEFIDEEIKRYKAVVRIVTGERKSYYKKIVKQLKQIKAELEALKILKSKLYLPEENDCDTLDDGSKVYMIYAKGVFSEEEYKALKEVFGDE